MPVSFKGAHFPQDIILMGVRWYVAYPLSYRHVEELMEERGVPVDHATIQRWVIKYSAQLEATFHRRKRSVGRSWRMDETYIRVKGEWRYLYRAVDKHGQTIDFLLTAERDEQAAKRFLTKAIRRHGVPDKITIDGSAANEAAITSYNDEHGTAIEIRKLKYLNNIVEQDHRAVKRVTRPMLGFKSFDAARSTLIGVELMHMLRKGQLAGGVGQNLTWPNSSMLWPRNRPTDSNHSPQSVYYTNFATKPSAIALGYPTVQNFAFSLGKPTSTTALRRLRHASG
jgi:putative transposase